MEDPYERAHQIDVEQHKKEKAAEAEAAFKLNLHPKDTFDKEKVVYGTDVQFPEVLLSLCRNIPKIPSSTSSNTKPDGKQAVLTKLDCMDISHLSLHTRRTPPKRPPASPRKKVERSPSEE